MFILPKVYSRILILNCVFILIFWCCIIYRFLIGRLIRWCWFVCWGGVVNWAWFRNWGRVIYWSGFVYWWGWVVWGWLVYWDMSWGMYSSAVFFSSVWVVYVLWGGMGLARDSSVISSMWLVYSYFDSWGIAVLYDLVTALVSQSNSQKSRDSDESL